MMKIRVEQFEENTIDKQLELLQKKLETGAVQAVMKSNGRRIINTARSLAPHRTGVLRRAIGFIDHKDKDFPDKVLIGIKNNKQAKSSSENPAAYGTILQYSAWKSQRTAIKFMEISLEMNREAVTKGIEKGLKALIEKSKPKT